MVTRRCGARRCRERIPSGMLMCRRHWFMVPAAVRDEVWRAYRREGILSDAYLEARDAAISSVAEQEATV